MVGQTFDKRGGVPRTDLPSLEKYKQTELGVGHIKSGLGTLSELAKQGEHAEWQEYFDDAIKLQDAMMQLLSDPSEVTLEGFQKIMGEIQGDTSPADSQHVIKRKKVDLNQDVDAPVITRKKVDLGSTLGGSDEPAITRKKVNL
jgi:hypothetical protein